ncbi:MAG: [Fe-Fe] hydrogenase large subunit C-terminal domain-containing protein [Spirochaetota bacterium]
MEIPLVQTIKEKCRVCYTCVRECPAKAIRIYNGQAEVIYDRCIGCGNCVKVCTQKAKKVHNSKDTVLYLLASSKPVAACVAPSFAAEFYDIDHTVFVGMLRNLGFTYVYEVAFGADIVAMMFRHLVYNNPDNTYISTSCPAIVNYIEKYHPKLIAYLPSIPSPMVAMGEVIKKIHGNDIPVVFIGPCLAKKGEASRPDIRKIITEALTFAELRELFDSYAIHPSEVHPSDFDPPHSGKGMLFPLGRGMLQAADMNEDLLENNIFATDGTKQFVHTLKEFEENPHNIKLMEILCCNGCIMGPGMTTTMNHFSRRALLSNYVKKRYTHFNEEEWQKYIEQYGNLQCKIHFNENDKRFPRPTREAVQSILERLGKYKPEDELNCGACGYDTCVDHAIAIYMGMAESEMCLPYTIDSLKATAQQLQQSYKDLMDTKNALIQSEKLASLGRMASGIAHEINNPLTGVLSYASLLLEDLKDSDFEEDLHIIIKETLRCREIVKGLLNFARETKSEKALANINEIIDSALSILQNHMSFRSITIVRHLDTAVPLMMLDSNHMRSVINNLAENAAHAMPDGGTITVSTQYDNANNAVIIKVADTGCGISEENINKIFDPFFTTKPQGKGTGLGLAVVFGIIRQHDGTINVESEVGKGTTFTITLPVG